MTFDIEIAVLLIGTLLGTGGAVGFLKWWSTRAVDGNSADDIAVTTAERVVGMVNEELKRRAALEEELRAEVAELRRQRERHIAYVEVLISVLADHGISAPPLEDWL